ncbi:hypothetical protein TruAng_007693 [Truncatella angustata]|nr:hypothetical protein TruAng_007693 [Truncatella angustata]
MNSLTILETAGTLSNLLRALGKTLLNVAELRRQWGDDDLTVLALENQLLTLRGAMSQTNVWIEQSLSSQLGLPNMHHQLVLGLDRCIACCRLLIIKVDADMLQLQQTTTGHKPGFSRLFPKMRNLRTRNLKKLQLMIQQQTSALTLLLTACNTSSSSAAISQQEALLATPQTRRVLEAMEDNTSSLFMHRDTDSLVMSSSSSSASSSGSSFGGASRRLLKFDFDQQLFVSQVYQQWSRSFLRRQSREEDTERNALNTATPYVNTEDKFSADGYQVETREKFSILPPIITNDKLVAYDTSEIPVETKEKFTVDPTDVIEKIPVEGKWMTPVETKEKFIVSPTDGSLYSATANDSLSVSSPSTLSWTRSNDSSSKSIWRRRRFTTEMNEDRTLRTRSRAIDNVLKQEQRRKKPYESKVLLFGSQSRSQLMTAAHMKDKKTHTAQELDDYRDVILRNLKECALVLVEQMRDAQLRSESQYLWGYVDAIETYHSNSDSKPHWAAEELDKRFVEGLRTILKDPLVQDLIRQCYPGRIGVWPGPGKYYFDSLSRISAAEYVPTDLDILRLTTFHSDTRGTPTVEVLDQNLAMALVDVGGLTGKTRKWMHQFEAAQLIVFVVDLEECHEAGQMIETMQEAKNLVESPWFSDTNIMILLDVRMADEAAGTISGNLFSPRRLCNV